MQLTSFVKVASLKAVTFADEEVTMGMEPATFRVLDELTPIIGSEDSFGETEVRGKELEALSLALRRELESRELSEFATLIPGPKATTWRYDVVRMLEKVEDPSVLGNLAATAESLLARIASLSLGPEPLATNFNAGHFGEKSSGIRDVLLTLQRRAEDALFQQAVDTESRGTLMHLLERIPQSASDRIQAAIANRQAQAVFVARYGSEKKVPLDAAFEPASRAISLVRAPESTDREHAKSESEVEILRVGFEREFGRLDDDVAKLFTREITRLAQVHGALVGIGLEKLQKLLSLSEKLVTELDGANPQPFTLNPGPHPFMPGELLRALPGAIKDRIQSLVESPAEMREKPSGEAQQALKDFMDKYRFPGG